MQIKAKHFGACPVDAEFDPEDWLARLRGGEAERDLMKIDTQGELSPFQDAMEENSG